eukprot:SAG11_NODE_22253_length_409_cov_1.158065_1_plen_35_part_01
MSSREWKTSSPHPIFLKSRTQQQLQHLAVTFLVIT